MTEEARELHRIIGATVRDMVSVYRLQAQMGPVTVQALEEILFRAAHGVVSHAEPVAWVIECSRPVRKNVAPLRRPSCDGDLEANTLCQRRWWPQGDAPIVGRRATGMNT